MKYNVERYLERNASPRIIITFGGAFSNHIAATAAIGKAVGIETLGIIRGEELEHTWQENPTLRKAHENKMSFRFVNRTDYRDKEALMNQLETEFPQALIVPEGGSNEDAVQGIQGMMTAETQDFDYLCTAVGTGGTLAGISRFATPGQKVLGMMCVKDVSLKEKVWGYFQRDNFTLMDASDGGYGKISEENVSFINSFYSTYGIKLEPLYTGKMMAKLFTLIEQGFFPEDSSILAFHTGGLQGIEGANLMLRKKNRPLIHFI